MAWARPSAAIARATSSSWSGLAPSPSTFPMSSPVACSSESASRALMRKPILIFMDEPFGALDAQTREQLQEDFLAIWSRTGATVIFVTHSIDEALILSDRIFVFHTAPGRIPTIVDSPLAGDRLGGDVRTHPDFGKCRAELRDMLRSEP
jgi:NitT/TauT family transport system ATP-binding protein